MSKDDPGYVTLSKPVGYTYGFFFIVAVLLAIILPATLKKDTEDKIETRTYKRTEYKYEQYVFDPFVADLDPFDIWEVSDAAQAAYEALDDTEKLGQMSLWDPSLGLTGPAFPADYEQMVIDGGAGTYINIMSYDEVKNYQDLAKGAGRPPVLIAYDTIHGFSTIFPVNIALSCAWDTEMIEEISSLAAKEMKSDGVMLTFAPMVDVSRDPRWGRVMESSGEDPYVNGMMGAATVRGFQKEGVASCVKHMAAYGMAEAGLDYMATRASLLELYNTYYRSYHWAMMGEDQNATGVNQAWSAMASYHLISGKAAHGDDFFLTDVLRGLWKWNGMVVADFGGVYQMVAQGYTANMITAAMLGIQSGVNQNMGDSAYWTVATNATYMGLAANTVFREKTILEHAELAAKRVITLKDKLGLFEKALPDNPPTDDDHYRPEALDLAREAAEKSAVLLKNKDSVMPIDITKATKNILVVGEMADNPIDILGSWIGKHARDPIDTSDPTGPVKYIVTYKAGIEAYVTGKNANIKVEYAKGYAHPWQPDMDDPNLAKIQNEEKEAMAELEGKLVDSGNAVDYEYVIAVFGEPSDAQGEAASKTNLTIAGGQYPVFQRLVEYKKQNPTTKLILVYNAGRPLTILDEYLADTDVILYMWSSGMRGGEALPRLLFGDVAPGGRLTMTFPRSVGQLPIYYAQYPSGRPATKKPGDSLINPPAGETTANPSFTSDYIDEYTVPLFPFGYGLTYDTFEYGLIELSADSLPTDTTEKLSIKVAVNRINRSNLPAVEIVQVYIHDLVASISQPKKRLVAFKRVEFGAADTLKDVTIEVDVQQHFGFYDRDLHYTMEAGEFDIYVAHNAADDEHVLKFSLTA